MTRVGRISYANMAPFFFALRSEVEEVTGVPREINRLLLAGELDAAPISSIEYARNADRLRLLPRLCVSSDGEVGSVAVFASRPLESVRTLAVTPESATSVVLARTLLADAEHVRLGEEADGTLLIGDAALRRSLSEPGSAHDLGALWRERTGLPMVYALWAASESVAGDVAAELEDTLLASVRLARDRRDDLAREAAERHGFPPAALARYFAGLRYELGPRERAGLRRFLELAHEAGELDVVPDSLAAEPLAA